MRNSMPSTARKSGRTSRSSRRTAKPRRSAAEIGCCFSVHCEGGPELLITPCTSSGWRMEQDVLDRFARDLDALIPREDRLGIAVSGGPDSIALLLLAASARPGRIEAATIDHGLRPESREEAEMVARLCDRLGVPHSIQVVGW